MKSESRVIPVGVWYEKELAQPDQSANLMHSPFSKKEGDLLCCAKGFLVRKCPPKEPPNSGLQLPELEYVSHVLNSHLPKEFGPLVVDCVVEHYKNILRASEKKEADRWLLEETVKDLRAVMSNRAALIYALITSLQFLSVRQRTYQRSALISGSALRWQRKLYSHSTIIAHVTPVALIILILAPAWLGVLELSGPSETKDQNRGHPSWAETSRSEPPMPGASSPPPAPVAPTPAPRPTPLRVEGGNKPGPKESTEPPQESINRDGPVRGSSNDGKKIEAKTVKKRGHYVSFSLNLVSGSYPGAYDVILKDLFYKTLARKRAASYDGKTLDVVFNWRRGFPSDCLISVQLGGEAPTNYTVHVSPK